MTLRLAVASVLTLGLAGCAHANLEGSDLDKVQHPAFVSRVADEAGPRVDVYRSDSAQASKLGGTSPADADRKLEESLKPALSRFEAAERLRSHVQAAIQTEKPWSQAIPPSQVASALETFLVQEVPGGAPDYGRLKPLGRGRGGGVRHRGVRDAHREGRLPDLGEGNRTHVPPRRRRRDVAERLLRHLHRGGAPAPGPRGALAPTRAPSTSRWSRCSTRCRSGWPAS